MKTKTMLISLFGTSMGIVLGHIVNIFISDYQLAVTAAAASVVTAIFMEETDK